MLKPGRVGLAIVVGLMLSLFLFTSGAQAQGVDHSNANQIIHAAIQSERASPGTLFQIASGQSIDLRCNCGGLCVQSNQIAYAKSIRQHFCPFGRCFPYRHCDDWWCSSR